MYEIHATLIWKFDKASYSGNNWFYGILWEQAEEHRLNLGNITTRKDGDNVKVSVDVTTETGKHLADEDAVTEFLENLVNESELPSVYLVLVDVGNTEFANLEATHENT